MLLRNTRHAQILALVQNKSEVRVESLAERLKVSSMTIRRDLQALEEQGKLTRVHGGAVLSGPGIVPPAERRSEHQSEKRAIGRRAAERIAGGMDVFIGSGSTTLALAEILAEGPAARYATNSVYVAQALGALQQQDIHVFGGALWRSAGTFVGPETIEMIERRHFDLSVIGIDAIDVKRGLMEPTEWQAWLVRTLRRQAETLMVVADRSKFARKSEFRVLGLNEVDILVTGSAPDEGQLNALRRQGVEVLFPD